MLPDPIYDELPDSIHYTIYLPVVGIGKDFIGDATQHVLTDCRFSINYTAVPQEGITSREKVGWC